MSALCSRAEPTCFDRHDAMKRDAKVWASLQLVGYMPTENDAGNECRLELRNCGECHSTIAIEVR